MEKVKRYLILFLFTCFTGYSQDDIIRPGLIKAMATISPGKMFGYNESYFYLHGNLEGYLNKRVSVSGEGYASLGQQTNASEGFNSIDNLFFGLNYHFVKGNGDLFIGGQPGVCFASLKEGPKVSGNGKGVSPVFSAVAGYTYFVGKFFNFFVSARYIAGSHNYGMHKDLSEIRFSAGLGFNINTISK
jgi:hypothetical protein